MKTSKYIIIVILFIALVISITVSTLYIKYEIKGEFNYNRNYYEITYSNISVLINSKFLFKIDSLRLLNNLSSNSIAFIL